MAGFILTMIIMMLIATVFIASMISIASKDEVVIDNKSVLYLSFDENIPERSPSSPFSFSSTSMFETTNVPGLLETLDLLKKASEDDNIKGIYLQMSDVPSGMGIVEELRNGLLEFKKSGKFIIAYGEMFSQKAYYLASVSDQIFVNPEGSIDFKGLTGQSVFLRGLLSKLDINAQIIRHGKYKSAIEPFISDKMSEANKEQTLTYINAIWNHMSQQMSVSRNIPVEKLQLVADSLLLATAKDAKEHGFIDDVFYKDQVINLLKTKLGVEEKDQIKLVSLAKFRDVKPSKVQKRSKNKIAVIYAVGDIMGGEGSDEIIGSERISRAIRKARMDSSIKAIVLRINSPGGSALASDVILREVNLAKSIKPVVASMSDLAASGGYYIACGADSIIADPTTLTGSIGVFGVIPDFQKFFNNKLGITFDHVKTNKNSDFISVTRPMTPYEEKVMTNSIERIYSTFIGHVSEGRDMDVASVDSIGQGRVWSGIDGVRLNLVDELGGIKDAIKVAASMAKLEEYRIVSLPEQKDPFTQIMEDITGEPKEVRVKAELGVFYPFYKEIKSLSNMKGVQARLPFSLEVY